MGEECCKKQKQTGQNEAEVIISWLVIEGRHIIYSKIGIQIFYLNPIEFGKRT